MTPATRSGRACATIRAMIPPRLTPTSVTGPWLASDSMRAIRCLASIPTLRTPRLRPRPQS